MRKVSVIAITATYLDITFATTANITQVAETGGYFVRTVICTIIWASFPMNLVNDMKGKPMRLIDADEILEHAYREKLDSRELIAEMIKSAPTVTNTIEMEKMCEGLKAHIEWLSRENDRMKGEIKALAFAVRCGGVSGNEVRYEDD